MHNKGASTFLVITIVVMTVVLLAVLITGGVIYYKYYYQEAEEKEEKEEEEEELFEIIETGDIPYEEKYTFSIETAEFIVYPPNFDSFEFGYFEAYNKGEKIYASEPIYMIMDLFSFRYKENKYIVVSDYSGGAHCCSEAYVFLLDKDNDLKLIETLPLGNTSISEDSLIMEDDDLYLAVFDDRFAYFYTFYANSYFFVRYLKVEDDKLISSNDAFQESYLEEAVRCEGELEEQLKTGEDDFEFYSPFLVCITVNYMLAGQEAKAWQKFNEYSSEVPLTYYGGAIDLEEFKKGLEDMMRSL